MKKGQRAKTDDESRKPCAPETRQSIFGRRVVLGHPPVSGLVARAVFEDEPGLRDGHTREEASKGNSHRVVMFLKELGTIFFRPPSPPKEGGKEREK